MNLHSEVINKIVKLSTRKIIEIILQLIGFAIIFYLIKLLVANLTTKWGFETMVSYLLILLLIKENVVSTIYKIMDTVIK